MAIGNLFPEYLAQNTIFLPHSFGFGIPLTFSTCPYRIPLDRRCLVYLWILVPCVVTPCGIMVQCDQTNPFSYYMKGKSERAIILNCYDLLKISTFVTLEGWTQDFGSCPVCLLQTGDDRLSLDPSYWCVCLDRMYWLGMALSKAIGSFRFDETGFVLIWVIDVSVLTGCTDSGMTLSWSELLMYPSWRDVLTFGMTLSWSELLMYPSWRDVLTRGWLCLDLSYWCICLDGGCTDLEMTLSWPELLMYLSWRDVLTWEWLLSQAFQSFCFWPVYQSSTFQVLAVNEDCGLIADG